MFEHIMRCHMISDVTGPPNHRPITGHCPVVLAAILQLNLGTVICFTRALETWRNIKRNNNDHTWWRTTHGSWLWVSSPQWFKWDFCRVNPLRNHWGELTHNHEPWVVRHQADGQEMSRITISVGFLGTINKYKSMVSMASMASIVPTHQPDIVDILDIDGYWIFGSIEHGPVYRNGWFTHFF